MPREDTDLPFGDAFSPAQLSVREGEEELSVVLEFIEDHEGHPIAFDKTVADRFFSSSPDPENRAKNVRLGVGPVGYQVVDGNFQFTDLGEELNELRDEPEKLYRRFAKHILLNLHGLKVINIIRDLEAEGKRTVNANIKQELRDQYGFHIDDTSNHWSQMRAWLAKADLINTRSPHYDIDDAALEDLIGLGEDELLELEGLTNKQQAFLRGLALINPGGPIRNSVVRKVAETAYGVKISQSNISKKTLDPLTDAGYIDWEHRDGKPNRIVTTDKFDAEVLKPILDDLAERIGIPRSVLRQSFSEILEQMDADSTHEKGVALETLAIKLGRMIGLKFAGWRYRGTETNGSEVDVIMDEVGTSFSRWQVQCKNTKSELKRQYVEREVGITRTLQTNVVLMVARGGVSDGAREFANQVMQNENIAVMFVTGDVLDRLDERPDLLFGQLHNEAERVERIKRIGDRERKERADTGEVAEREEKALDEYEEDLDDFEDDYDDRTLDDFDNDDD